MTGPDRGALPPAVSVIIPCYKQAHYLAEAVRSVVDQTFDDWECIVVDDGSPDDTAAVATALIEANPGRPIRLLRQQNQGLSGARNAGIRAARGRYILPLDADDRLAPTMLAKTAAVLEGDPGCSIVYTHIQVFGVEQGVWEMKDFVLPSTMLADTIGYCSLYRRCVWERVGGYQTNLDSYEDWNFWIGALRLGFRGTLVPEPLFCYRRATESMVTRAAQFRDRLTARIVLNHPDVYPPERQGEARALLAPLGLAGEGAAAGPAGGPVREPPGPYPTVSVILPTYNRRILLDRAVRSVLAQTFQDFEIIVVNDGGDSPADWLAAVDVGGKVQLINLAQSRGPAAARNAGLRLARGRLIAYLDDDDLYDPEHLETLVRALEVSDAPMVYSRARRVYQHRVGDETQVTGEDTPFEVDFDATVLLATNYIPVVTVMHRRSLLDGSGFDETLPLLETWDLWIRLSRSHGFVHLPRVTCQFAEWTDHSGLAGQRRALAAWCMRRIRRVHPEAPAVNQYEEQLRTVEALVAEGMVPAAVARMEAYVAAVPTDGRGHGDLGVLYNMLGRTTDAVVVLLRAIDLDGQNPGHRRNLAAVHLQAGRVQDAMKALEEVLARDPRDVEALLMIGDASAGLGKARDAADLYHLVLKIDPMNAEAAQRLAGLR